MKTRTKILDRKQLVDWVGDYALKEPNSIAAAMILIGDRLSCCDEAVGTLVDGKVVSVATIAPNGEQLTDVPTIVALYTLSEHRHKGYGRMAFLAAIKRCRKRGFTKVHIDVMSAHVNSIIESLSEEDRAYLDVVDYGSIMDSFN